MSNFLNDHGSEVMLKVMGLSGARNVTVIDSVGAAKDYLKEYDDDLELASQYQENID